MSDGREQSQDGAARGVAAAYAMLALVVALWAGNAIAARSVRDAVPPFTLALMRWTAASLVLAPVSLRHVWAERRAIARAWRPILLLGILGVACFNGFLYSGLRYTTAANAMLLQAAIPGLVLAADLVLFRIRPGRTAVTGVVLSTLGVAFIVLRGDPATLARTGFNGGDLLVLGGVVCWALYTALLKLRPALHPSSFLAVTFAIGALAMAPLAAGEWAGGRHVVWSLKTGLAVAYVAVLPSVVAYALFNAAVARLGAGPAGQAINLMPLFGALLAAALLGEPLHGYHLVGMALVLAGIGVGAVATMRRARTR